MKPLLFKQRAKRGILPSRILLATLVALGIWDEVVVQGAQTPRMKLGAYYFDGWAGKCKSDNGKPGNEWAKGMPSNVTKRLVTEFAGREPIWGWRDDSQELMERQIDLAADHGISFFPIDWYWSDKKGPINVAAIENNSLNTATRLFMEARNNTRMEFCLLICNQPGFEITGEPAWKQGADYWIPIFKHPRYLKVEGKPLLMIFQPWNADKHGLAYLQEAARKVGFPGVAVAARGRGKTEDGFALKTDYNMIPGFGQPSASHTYQELFEYHAQRWQGSKEQPYIPALSVGWDRRPWEGGDGLYGIGVTTSWYFEGKTPEAFGRNLEKLKEWMEQHPEQITKDRLAVIFAWNELGEGGWLVPCREDPDGAYLKVIKRVVLGK